MKPFKISFKEWEKRNRDFLKKQFEIYWDCNITYDMFCKIYYLEVVRKKRFYSKQKELYTIPLMAWDNKINFAHKVSLYAMDYLKRYDSNHDPNIQPKMMTFLLNNYEIAFAIYRTFLYVEMTYTQKLFNSLKRSSFYKSLTKKQKAEFDKLHKEKIEISNVIETLTVRNIRLERQAGVFKPYFDLFVQFYHKNKSLGGAEKIYKLFQKEHPALRSYPFKRFWNNFKTQGYRLKKHKVIG